MGTTDPKTTRAPGKSEEGRLEGSKKLLDISRITDRSSCTPGSGSATTSTWKPTL